MAACAMRLQLASTPDLTRREYPRPSLTFSPLRPIAMSPFASALAVNECYVRKNKAAVHCPRFPLLALTDLILCLRPRHLPWVPNAML